MNDTLTSLTWWKAAAKRALVTAIAVAIPYFGAVTVFGSINWLTLGGAVLLAFILSLVTSLAGIAEVQGVVKPEWEALLERSVKTFAQALVAGIGSSLVFQDVHWSVILQASVIAAVTSLLRSLVADLPETPAPIDAGTAIPGQAAVITSVAAPVPAVSAAVSADFGTVGMNVSSEDARNANADAEAAAARAALPDAPHVDAS